MTAPLAEASAGAVGVARRKRDDRLALAAILIGMATALVGVRAPLTLTTGVAIDLAGVLLAVRGDRAVPAPQLMSAALTLAVLTVLGAAALVFYEEWDIGQRLAEGAPPASVGEALRPYVRLGAALRSLSLFLGLSLLLGATVTRFAGSGK